jgi:hypothetical protein
MPGNPTTLWAALKAAYWNRLEGGGSYTAQGLAYGHAHDNGFIQTAFDPSGSNCSNGNAVPALELADANGRTALLNPNGTYIGGQIAGPSNPTVTRGGSGASTWTYAVVGRTASGNVAPGGGSTAVSTSAATLTAAAPNVISGVLNPNPGYAYLDIYRIAVGSSPSTTGKIASIACATLPPNGAWTLLDTGLAGDSATYPATNTTGGLLLGPASLSAPVVLTATVPLTSAMILAMGTTPQTILATPGANKALIIYQIVLQTKPSGTAYANGGVTTFVYHGGSITPHGSNIPAATIISGTGTLNVLPPNPGVIQPPTNTGLDITTASAAFITGTGTGIVTVQYSVLTTG